MPKSKTRGSLKEHRKRVVNRNNTIKGLQRKAQAEYQAMFTETMEKLKAQYESENENKDEVNDITVTDTEIITPEVSDEN